MTDFYFVKFSLKYSIYMKMHKLLIQNGQPIEMAILLLSVLPFSASSCFTHLIIQSS